jgi:hypothetical protein
MAEEFNKGDRVEWDTPQGPTVGVVVRKLTGPAQVGGHTAAASAGSPEYLVRSDKSGKEAAHRPEALRRR